MNEKIAVADILSSVNQVLTQINYSILQGDNENFRNILSNHRDTMEDIQYNLYKVGKEKGYYIPALPADQKDIDQVKNELDK